MGWPDSKFRPVFMNHLGARNRLRTFTTPVETNPAAPKKWRIVFYEISRFLNHVALEHGHYKD